MTVTAEIREQVRQRANFACEFCGVTETDVGGELTLDHFQPTAKGGNDSPENLLYCCARCNQYKADYWPTHPGDLSLWNPRREPFAQHFDEQDDGTLEHRTVAGLFTLKRLRLNRQPLVAHRLRKRQWTRYLDLVQSLKQLYTQQFALMEEQRQLLEEQRELLRLLLGRRE